MTHLTAAIMTVRQFPPSESFSRRVSLLFLYGMKPLPCKPPNKLTLTNAQYSAAKQKQL